MARFLLMAAVFFTIYYFPSAHSGLFRAYLAAYAQLAGWAISWFDPTVEVRGTQIAGQMTLEFAENCDASAVGILITSAILAFPASWRQRILRLVATLVGLVVVNVVRIVTLYFIGANFPSRFDLFHMQIWPFMIVALAAGGFALWARATTLANGGLYREVADSRAT